MFSEFSDPEKYLIYSLVKKQIDCFSLDKLDDDVSRCYLNTLFSILDKLSIEED